jgi:hypothetical protein
MRQRAVAKIESGEHLFVSPAFQAAQAEKQRAKGAQGAHSSQDPTVKAKRRATVSNLIAAMGKFFSHTPEQLKEFRNAQVRLYEKGLGKFQQPGLIAANQARVREELKNGTHFSQREGWSERARSAASKQMKPVCLAIRRSDGSTTIHSFASLHSAEVELGINRSHLSSMCNGKSRYKSLSCDLGLVIKACFGVNPSWCHEDLAQAPTVNFLATKPVLVTIELANGSITERSFLSQRAACASLDAHHRAFRWIIKGEKYKSTRCNLGKIIRVIEIDPLPEHIEQLIALRGVTRDDC